MWHRTARGPAKAHARLAVRSIVLAALSAAAVNVIATSASAVLLYDRAAAVAYGDKYANIVVSDGYFWINGGDCNYYGAGTPVPTGSGVAGGVGDDCAHFVSSSIGSEPHEKGGGLAVPSIAGYSQYGNPAAQGIVDWLVNTSKYGTKVSGVSQLTPGDVIGFDWDGDNHIDHVGLYTGNNKLDTHAASHKEVNWTSVGSSSKITTFVHITVAGYAPGTPTNSSPATNTVLTNQTPTLSATSFVNTNLGGFQTAAEWQIMNSRGALVWDSGTDASHLTSLPVPTGTLVLGATYSWKVRYQDNYGDWSSYSALTALTAGLFGDFDHNGTVDAADYVVWRNGGSPNPNSASDYNSWRGNLGATMPASGASQSLAVSQSAAVPEPASLALSLLPLLGAVAHRRERPRV
jgi:hypothetical protein